MLERCGGSRAEPTNNMFTYIVLHVHRNWVRYIVCCFIHMAGLRYTDDSQIVVKDLWMSVPSIIKTSNAGMALHIMPA